MVVDVFSRMHVCYQIYVYAMRARIVAGSGAGDQTAAALGESLKHNTSLMYIDLSGKL